MDEEVYRNCSIDRRRLKALAQRSDAAGMIHLSGHLIALAASGTAVMLAGHWAVFAAAVLGHGAILIFLFAPLHECIHRTAFKRRWLNDLVARLCGFLLLLPADYFRGFHFQHHRCTQDPQRDPELKGSAIDTLAAYMWQISGLPYWRERVVTIARHCLGRVEEDFIVERARPAITAEARGHAAAYLALLAGSFAFQSTLLLGLWLLPALLGQPLLRLFLLAEHGGCPATPDMLVNSRTTETAKPVEWLCWNMNRHSAHHAYPALPFHALPQADALLESQPMTRADGYLAVHHDLIAALRRNQASLEPSTKA